jgi:phosphomannomutase
MNVIKFGTDGWRAIIAQDFTVANLERVAYATAIWLKKNYGNPTAVVGNDVRFAGKLFSETTARILAKEGIKVFFASNDFVSTPMISLGAIHYKAQAGIIITASHNPPGYNGFKIKAYYGGPATPSMIAEVEENIPESYSGTYKSLEEYEKEGLIEKVDLEDLYVKQVEKSFDLDSIRNSGFEFGYDAMFGAGQNVMHRILPDLSFLHCDHNPGFEGTAPEPILKNLHEIQELLKISGDMAGALVTDGDADRIGLFDGEGNFIDSHHILLLLIHYLHKYKKQNGHVLFTFSCTQKIAKLCEIYKLPYTITKIGFKYICDLILQEGGDFLVGGEESGGLAIRGHIPERDGIWIGLTLWEFMAGSGKTLNELIQEIYALVGAFAVERYDLKLTEEKKQSIIQKCTAREFPYFGKMKVVKVEDMDGFKFHFEDESWVMIRPSGTEPVLRVYAESKDSKTSFSILDTVKETLLK